MRKALLLLIAIVSLALAVPSSVFAACSACSQDPLPGLEGQWRGHVVATDRSGTGSVATLAMTLDDHGVMVSGGLTDLSGTTVGMASGCLIIDEHGQLGGSFTDVNGVLWCLPTGKLSPNGGLISFVYQTWDDIVGHAALIKEGGAFALSDLDGSYEGQTFRVGPAAIGPGNLRLRLNHGVLGINAYSWIPGSSGTYQSASLALAADGSLSGSLTADNGTVQTIDDGLLDNSKTMASAALRQSDGDGVVAFMMLPGTACTPSDLGGSWLLISTEANNAGSVAVLDSVLDIDIAGSVTGGAYSYLQGGDGALAGGTLTALADCTVSGRYLRDDQVWHNIVAGAVDAAKDVVTLTYSADNGQRGKALMVRTSEPPMPPSDDGGTTLPATPDASGGGSGGGGGGGCTYDPAQAPSQELLAVLVLCSACAAVGTFRRGRR